MASCCPSIGLVSDVKQLDILLDLVELAQEKFSTMNQSQVDKIFEHCAVVANQNRLHLAQLAIEEAGMGNLEDKVLKNHFSAETVYHAYKDMKTCGIVEEDIVHGYALYAEPVGILAGIVPCTNPTSTTIFKILIALKTRNSIVISPHPRTSKCTIMTAKLLREAAVSAGAPQNCIAWLDVASIDLCTKLMRHPKIAMIVATGAGSLIKSAYSSGKPCMGGGAGNTPVIIDETADIPLSVNSILLSKTFDNGMICASEQSIIAVESIASKVEEEFIRRGGYFLKNKAENEKLERVIYKDNGALNPDAVGQPASKLIQLANIDQSPENVRVILAHLSDVGPEEGLSREKLCPCLGFYVAKNYDKALDLALRLVRFGGLGHTSVFYTDLSGIYAKERVQKFKKIMPTGRTLLCMPTSQGAIGGLFNSKQNPSMSLGCGSWGGNSSAEGLQPKHLLNYKQIAERRGTSTTIKVPEFVRIGEGIVEENVDALLDSCLMSVKHIGILHENFERLTPKELSVVQHLIKTVTELSARKGVYVTTFDFPLLSKSPEWVLYVSTVLAISEKMGKVGVDTILAVGGTRIIDTAKLVRLVADNHAIDWDLLGTRFMSMSQRVIKFPPVGDKIKMLGCIPTEFGSGAEISPYALVINDINKTESSPAKIITVVDWTLLPKMAIIDCNLPLHMPENIALNCACCTVSNTLESMVSILATEKTRQLSETAFCVLTKNFIESVKGYSGMARVDFHRASAYCGMASANAFLGIVESISHQLVLQFMIPPGIAKFMILSQVIKFNAEDAPSKLAAYPHYERPKAKEQYAQLTRAARLADLPESASADECLEALLDYLRKVKESLGIPLSIKNYGIQEKMYMEKLDSMAMEAFDDQFTGTNPRYPLITELVQILMDAYHGNISRMRFDDIQKTVKVDPC